MDVLASFDGLELTLKNRKSLSMELCNVDGELSKMAEWTDARWDEPREVVVVVVQISSSLKDVNCRKNNLSFLPDSIDERIIISPLINERFNK